ncbi:hypothetical protein Adt_03432 [Abeliophyllum distichum]|uniref:Uncharacterized protein n=1 Tax=Abeliophyllum distichum TaxID=126358 RepID=A0ABD1VYI1_9LAMI
MEVSKLEADVDEAEAKIAKAGTKVVADYQASLYHTVDYETMPSTLKRHGQRGKEAHSDKAPIAELGVLFKARGWTKGMSSMIRLAFTLWTPLKSWMGVYLEGHLPTLCN